MRRNLKLNFVVMALTFVLVVPAGAQMREAVLLTLAKPPSALERSSLKIAGLEIGTHLGRGMFLASVVLGEQAAAQEAVAQIIANAKIEDLPISTKLHLISEGRDPNTLETGAGAAEKIEIIVTPAVASDDQSIAELLGSYDPNAAPAIRQDGWTVTVRRSDIVTLAREKGVAQLETAAGFPLLK